MLFYIFYIILFSVGLSGVLVSNFNLIRLLLSLEIMALSCSFLFCFGSILSGDLLGFIFFLLNLSIAGCESAIGLILLINLYESFDNLTLDSLSFLKG